MSIVSKMELNTEEVLDISSDYISKGRQYESWKINKVIVDKESAIMDVSMLTFYPPETGEKDFHLSIYLAEEMASQLMIIYGHIWAGFTKKRQDVWMLESHTKSIRSIVRANHIKIEMNLKTMRKRGDTIFGIGDFRITDDQSGLIELRQKGILS